jgi:hypothetical protein
VRSRNGQAISQLVANSKTAADRNYWDCHRDHFDIDAVVGSKPDADPFPDVGPPRNAFRNLFVEHAPRVGWQRFAALRRICISIACRDLPPPEFTTISIAHVLI